MPPDTLSPSGQRALALTARQTLTVILVVALALFLWQIRHLLLLSFGGILLAVLLRAITRPVARLLHIAPGWALAMVTVTLIFAVGGFLFTVGRLIAEQFGSLAQQLPEGIQQVFSVILGQAAANDVMDEIEEIDLAAALGGDVFGQLTGIASTVVTVIVDVLLVLAIGLFLAASPDLYRKGAVMLLPAAYRARGYQVLDKLDWALRHWLLGQLASMTVVGIAVTAGLLLLGIPLAFALGLLAFLLEFIPYVGPFTSATPAVLIAFTQSPVTALYVIGFYILIQQLENYVLVPIVQREAVELPPALSLTAMVAFGLVFGLVGIFFAVPLTVVAMVLVRELYIKDTLDAPQP